VGIEEQQSFLPEKRQSIGAPHGEKMSGVLRNRVGERGSSCVRLLRLAGVDDCHEEIAVLGKIVSERHRPLAPGQAFREHQVGIGADPEMAGRVPSGECRENAAGQNHPPSVAAAAIDEAGQQILECHRKPRRQNIAAFGWRPSRPAG
jgi:hypothetical protein